MTCKAGLLRLLPGAKLAEEQGDLVALLPVRARRRRDSWAGVGVLGVLLDEPSQLADLGVEGGVLRFGLLEQRLLGGDGRSQGASPPEGEAGDGVVLGATLLQDGVEVPLVVAQLLVLLLAVGEPLCGGGVLPRHALARRCGVRAAWARRRAAAATGSPSESRSEGVTSVT